MKSWGILGALIASIAVQADASEVTFSGRLKGGPYDGIAYGDVTYVSDGRVRKGISASIPGASPVPVGYASVVAGLLNAYDRQDEDAARALFARDVAIQICEDYYWEKCKDTTIEVRLGFEEHCVSNTPYYVRDTDEIRLEWIFRGQLYYLSYLKIENGRIARFRTIPANIPAFATWEDRHG